MQHKTGVFSRLTRRMRGWSGLAEVGLFAAAAVASPECFDIVGSCTHAFVPGEDGYVSGGVSCFVQQML